MNNSNTETIKVKDASWQDLFSNKNGLKATALALGVMLHATNVYLATTIMPTIIKEIGGLEYYAWNTTIFVVASVIGSVISANRLAQSGPRKAYQIGILLFSLGTILCTLAPTMYILLFGRFVQGFGGGLLFALSYAMIRLVFDKNLWSRAMALISGMWGIAAFSGPFLGGLFAENGHWRWAFGSLLIFCILIYIISTGVLPKEKNKQTIPSIPYLKLSFLGLATLAVSVASVQESVLKNVVGVFIAVLFLFFLVISEKKQGLRLLPTGAYKISSALGATYTVMALLTIATSIEIYVPYFAQIIHNYSPLESGFLTVLIAIGWTLSSITFSGYKGGIVSKIILLGSVLMFLGILGLTLISHTNSLSSNLNLALTCAFLLSIGAGIGMGWPHLLTRVFSLSPLGEEDLTSSSVTTVQLIATSFGAALAGLITNLGGIKNPGGVAGAIDASFYLYGIFALTPLGATPVLILLRKKDV
ncbi:putative MFS family arabinose efflux permease [Pedobacter psychrotolerans]|uniref:MFS transporter n=1 Tax=Pedobacter psychrotolerans TaxID=1843235 RepID=A0A4R2H435_9SPHI|nr:MFS transporter [Pedobacter psychrotolerans]TCO19944.1 putative MFS family arabinose efflux permease [Pedobacter psychrotolerans]GGE50015.1 MFS transporter [Pedobacter psychrotolerans]